MQPYKSLDAPGLVGDFYLNLTDWSCQNVVAVGLHQDVYLTRFQKSKNNKVIHLCDFATSDDVGSLQFSESGELLAVGTNKGLVQNDSCVGYTGMHGRCNEVERPRNRDRGVVPKVCGLKWSPDKQQLGSCGADHRVNVWNLRNPKPCVTFTEHTAHLKAIAWSPHHRGLLTTGGGNRDGMLRFWDTIAGVPLQRISTGGSQICNVAWSKHSLELVTTHGYEDNNLITWKYPSLRQEIVQPNPARLVYMAMSPDGE